MSHMAERFEDHSTPRFPSFSKMLGEVEKFSKSKSGRTGAALSDAISGGKMLSEKTGIQQSDFGETYDLAIDQPDGFWDKVIDYSDGLTNVPVHFTDANKIVSSELTLGSNGEDIWRPGVSGTDPGDTTTTDTAEIVTIPEETVAIVQINDDALEDTIEGPGLEQHILNMMTAATANQFEAAAYNSTKVGTTNSARGSITGCFDGFLQLAQDNGNVVNAVDNGGDRLVDLDGSSNDKHIRAIKLMPDKYGQQGLVFMTAKTLGIDGASILGVQRLTALGDQWTQRGYVNGFEYAGIPWFIVPQLRTDYLVKGTGTKGATTPGDTTLSAISKARATTSTTAAITNFATGQSVSIGATASAMAAYNLNAETRVQSGTPSGSTLTWTVALTRDHASGEFVVEATTAATATGIPTLLTSWDNMRIGSQRIMRIEAYREPRKRATSFVMSARWAPFFINVDKTVLIRDLQKKL